MGNWAEIFTAYSPRKNAAGGEPILRTSADSASLESSIANPGNPDISRAWELPPHVGAPRHSGNARLIPLWKMPVTHCGKRNIRLCKENASAPVALSGGCRSRTGRILVASRAGQGANQG